MAPPRSAAPRLPRLSVDLNELSHGGKLLSEEGLDSHLHGHHGGGARGAGSHQLDVDVIGLNLDELDVASVTLQSRTHHVVEDLLDLLQVDGLPVTRVSSRRSSLRRLSPRRGPPRLDLGGSCCLSGGLTLWLGGKSLGLLSEGSLRLSGRRRARRGRGRLRRGRSALLGAVPPKIF